MEAFLSTPELLESLFLECEIRELLTSVQRVCRQWHEIINTTPSVQVHMYFRPARRVYRAPPRSPSHTFEGFEKTRSSSIASQESSASTSSLSTSSTYTTTDNFILSSSPTSSISSYCPNIPPPQLTITPTPNPLLAQHFAPFFTPYHEALSQLYCSRHDLQDLSLAKHPDSFLHENASWRRMLLQQPPHESLGVSMPETGYSVLYSRHNLRAKQKVRTSVTTTTTTTATTPEQQAHDGIIRMSDLYDTVLRSLANPTLRWKVLWRPNYTLDIHPSFSNYNDDDDDDSEKTSLSYSHPSSSSPTDSLHHPMTSNNEGQHTTTIAPWPVNPNSNNSTAIEPGTSPNLTSASSIFRHRQDLVGGCTTQLMDRGAEIIIVRCRERDAPFLGWSRFEEFQGRYLHPKWLGDKNGLERAGHGVVVTL